MTKIFCFVTVDDCSLVVFTSLLNIKQSKAVGLLGQPSLGRITSVTENNLQNKKKNQA